MRREFSAATVARMTETDTAPRVPQPEDIEALAAKRGISVVALCREAGVSRLAFRRWQKGETSLTVSNLEKLIKAGKA